MKNLSAPANKVNIKQSMQNKKLTQEKKEYFKVLLIQSLNELIAEANRSVSGFAATKDVYPDFLDQASMESYTDFTLRLRERESRLMRKIRLVLERLDEGNFGVCEQCGKKISEERLKARPMTTLCIKCKKNQEAIEKVRGF